MFATHSPSLSLSQYLFSFSFLSLFLSCFSFLFFFSSSVSYSRHHSSLPPLNSHSQLLLCIKPVSLKYVCMWTLLQINCTDFNQGTWCIHLCCLQTGAHGNRAGRRSAQSAPQSLSPAHWRRIRMRYFFETILPGLSIIIPKSQCYSLSGIPALLFKMNSASNSSIPLEHTHGLHCQLWNGQTLHVSTSNHWRIKSFLLSLSILSIYHR